MLKGFRESKIGEFNVPSPIEKDVFRFEAGLELNLLPIDDIALVQGLEGEDDLGSIEFGSVIEWSLLLFGEFIFEGEETEQLTSGTVLENEIEFLLILKGGFEFDEKGMIDVWKDSFLSHDIFLLIFFNDIFLFQYFHRIHMFVLLISDKENLCISPLTNHWQQRIVVNRITMFLIDHEDISFTYVYNRLNLLSPTYVF